MFNWFLILPETDETAALIGLCNLGDLIFFPKPFNSYDEVQNIFFLLIASEQGLAREGKKSNF